MTVKMPEACDQRKGPLPGPLGSLGAAVYARGVRIRNRKFDGGQRVEQIDRPVISIGNLSVGGTGKTPMVVHIGKTLRDAGKQPCIAMRGYKADCGGPCDESDEQAEYRQTLPGVRVLANPNRVNAIRSYLQEDEGSTCDCIVLDDGFQHRFVARDLDLVLVDASRSPFEDRLLPAGWLREPVESLARADAVIITHAELASEEQLNQLNEQLARVCGAGAIATTRHEWAGLCVADGGADSETSFEELSGRTVLAVCAIGNPDGFLRAAAEGVGPDGEVVPLVLRDHDPYRPQTVRRVVEAVGQAGASMILTTGKDWAKLGRLSGQDWPCPVARPTLRLGFVAGEQELAARILGVVGMEVG